MGSRIPAGPCAPPGFDFGRDNHRLPAGEALSLAPVKGQSPSSCVSGLRDFFYPHRTISPTLEPRRRSTQGATMKFGLYAELQTPLDKPYPDLYREIMWQMEHADQVGFDVYSIIEHHFFQEFSTSANP